MGWRYYFVSHLITGITCCGCNETVYGESIFRRRLQFSEILVCSGWKEKVAHAKE